MGTTGITIMEDGVVKELTDIKASDFNSEIEYWIEHIKFLCREKPDAVVCEGYRLYNHKGKEAKIQANSELQTPQLIGVIKVICQQNKYPLTIQFASEVKTRWSEDVLVRLGILELKGSDRKKLYYFNGKSTSQHHRDSLKHCLHYWRYKK